MRPRMKEKLEKIKEEVQNSGTKIEELKQERFKYLKLKGKRFFPTTSFVIELLVQNSFHILLKRYYYVN